MDPFGPWSSHLPNHLFEDFLGQDRARRGYGSAQVYEGSRFQYPEIESEISNAPRNFDTRRSNDDFDFSQSYERPASSRRAALPSWMRFQRAYQRDYGMRPATAFQYSPRHHFRAFDPGSRGHKQRSESPDLRFDRHRPRLARSGLYRSKSFDGLLHPRRTSFRVFGRTNFASFEADPFFYPRTRDSEVRQPQADRLSQVYNSFVNHRPRPGPAVFQHGEHHPYQYRSFANQFRAPSRVQTVVDTDDDSTGSEVETLGGSPPLPSTGGPSNAQARPEGSPRSPGLPVTTTLAKLLILCKELQVEHLAVRRRLSNHATDVLRQIDQLVRLLETDNSRNDRRQQTDPWAHDPELDIFFNPDYVRWPPNEEGSHVPIFSNYNWYGLQDESPAVSTPRDEHTASLRRYREAWENLTQWGPMNADQIPWPISDLKIATLSKRNFITNRLLLQQSDVQKWNVFKFYALGCGLEPRYVEEEKPYGGRILKLDLDPCAPRAYLQAFRGLMLEENRKFHIDRWKYAASGIREVMQSDEAKAVWRAINEGIRVVFGLLDRI